MNFLAIDTSNEYLTVVASKEGKAEVLFEHKQKRNYWIN